MKETLIVLTAVLLGGGILLAIVEMRKNQPAAAAPSLSTQIANANPGALPCCSDVPSTYSGLCTDDNGAVTTFDAFKRGVLPVGQGPALPPGYTPPLSPMARSDIQFAGITPWNQPGACMACAF